jgi:hypothetical protein
MKQLYDGKFLPKPMAGKESAKFPLATMVLSRYSPSSTADNDHTQAPASKGYQLF